MGLGGRSLTVAIIPVKCVAERRIITGGDPGSDIKKRQRALARSLHLNLGIDSVLKVCDLSLGNYLQLFVGIRSK